MKIYIVIFYLKNVLTTSNTKKTSTDKLISVLLNIEVNSSLKNISLKLDLLSQHVGKAQYFLRLNLYNSL